MENFGIESKVFGRRFGKESNLDIKVEVMASTFFGTVSRISNILEFKYMGKHFINHIRFCYRAVDIYSCNL